jgi:hypothetical protein
MHYQRVALVRVLTTTFIGPASARFLERQTTAHMNGLDFALLEKKHIPELAKWVEVSASLLIKPVVAKGLAQKITCLSIIPFLNKQQYSVLLFFTYIVYLLYK